MRRRVFSSFHRIESIGDILVESFHLIGLFLIGAAIVWATIDEILVIVEHSGPRIKDILLLFIYLELGAMVDIYFKTKRLPVRFLIYIAITALTRLLAIDVKTMSDERILDITLAILMLTGAVVMLKFGNSRFLQSDDDDEED